MRLFEIIITVLSLGMLWHVIWFRKRQTHWFGILLPLLLIGGSICHFIVEGGRWQMAFVYFSIGIVLLVYLIRALRPVSEQKNSKLAAILLSFIALPYCMIAVGLPCLLPVFSLEKPAGPYKVGTVTYNWIDENRKIEQGEPRRINVQIWYPAELDSTSRKAPYISHLRVLAEALEKQFDTPKWLFRYFDLVETNAYSEPVFANDVGKIPLVFFSHGNMTGAGFTNSFQTIELASHGYVVAAVEHPQTALTAAYPDGSFVPFVDFFSKLPMEYDAQNVVSSRVIEEQTQDLEFALEQMKKLDEAKSNSLFANKIDFLNVGLFGHSFGGATIVNTLYKNQLFKAGINMDGYIYGSDRTESIKQPVLLMNSDHSIDNDDLSNKMVMEEEKRRKRAFQEKAYILDIKKASHLNFTDFPLYSPLIAWISPDVKQNHQIVNEATIWFFDQHLKEISDRSLESIISKYPKINFRKGDE